jgi:hypothetical protein
MNLATPSPMFSAFVRSLFENAPEDVSIPGQLENLRREAQELIQPINQVRDRSIWEFTKDLVATKLTGLTSAERNYCHLRALESQIDHLINASKQGQTTIAVNALEIVKDRAFYATFNELKQSKAANLG